MQCPQCGFDNPTGMNFCGKCASPLAPRCPQCGFENPPSFAFCGKCATPLSGKAKGKGQRAKSKNPLRKDHPPTPNPQPPASYTPRHLAERIQAERAAMEARGAPDGERKTITALFADLKGSTALIEDLDPEDARKVIDPALQLMMEAVHRYEGYVAQSLGDGIFALFGAPIAHEDHAHRALYAALRMQEEMRRYGEQRRRDGSAPLLLRVGINTGEVVVRSIRKDDLQTEYVPVGYSTNVAARMETLATPGSIVVSEHTYKLTEGYFDFKALGETQVKGMSAPLGLYEVVGVSPLRTKMQVAARRGLARFVGRQGELEQLRNAFDQAKAGHGQIVGVMGEPGVGKSRLFYEFVGAGHGSAVPLRARDCLVLETFSVSHGKAYPYLPLIDLLKNYFQLALHDDERQRREKITGRVLTLDRSLEDTLPYLFFLLGIAEATSPLQQMDPQIRRKRTLEAIKRLLVRESLNQPVIIIFEDLHWLDAETQAFLSLLGESVATARILLLVNYRPEYRHEWGSKTYYTQLRLDPLGREQAEEMLTVLLGDISESPLPRRERERERVSDGSLESLKRFILDKTEGNPFFMEEIVQELRERGVFASNVEAPRAMPPPTSLHIPATVQAVLAARIDRLPPEEKTLLQTLAVIGKEFSLSLLKHVASYQEEELQQLLFLLRDAEFIYEQPAFPDVEYIFKHALTQEVAYNSMLIEQRKVVHECTAKALEEVCRTKLDDHYSELAHHYSRSGNTQKAVDYLQLAGQQAVQRSANTEAITHLTAALELLKTLPDTPKCSQQELVLQLTLGVPLQIIKGHAASEVGKTYNRVLELCGQVGETASLFPALFGLWRFYYLRPDVPKAHELAEQTMRLAQSSQDSSLLLVAHQALGASLFWLGELRQVRRHFEQGIALYDLRQHRPLAFLYGIDPGVFCLCLAGWNLWCLGYPDQALKHEQDALHLAYELAHPFTLAFAHNITTLLHQLRQEETAVRDQAEAALTISTEHGFVFRAALATIMQGWALATADQAEEGVGRMREGLAAQRATGAEANHPYFLSLLAERYGEMGQPEKGLVALTEASSVVQRIGERWYEAEVYRIKGELTLQKLSVVSSQLSVPSTQRLALSTQAEECFLKALEISRHQQAKSLELRAAVSLARLWQREGKRHEAHKMLSEIYNWFTEGFDTKDLQEAKALLNSLT